MIAVLDRLFEVHGTPGVLTIFDDANHFKARFTTGEDPWMNNAPDISCVPPGSYPVAWTTTPKHPNGIYMLQNVQGRTACEIHNGNYFGNTSLINPVTGKPFLSDVEGCVIIGMGFNAINGQDALYLSDEALNYFNNVLMNKESFTLTIRPANPFRDFGAAA